MPPKKQIQPLTEQEKQALLMMVAEAKARGIPIPEPPKQEKPKHGDWPVDKNGYVPNLAGQSFRPYPAQEAFLKSKARYVMFRGSRGAGKTTAGAQKALQKIMQGESGAVLNPSFENFKYSTWPEFRNWIPWSMVVPGQRHRKDSSWQPTQPFVMVFMNGARVYCKGLKDPDSARGPNINWLWYDEGGVDKTGEAWQLAISSVRVGVDPQAWTTTTPKGRNHWTYKFFVEQDLPKESLDAYKRAVQDRPFIEEFHGTAQDNKDNLDPAFYASILAAYPTGYLFQQEVNGEYADEGGQIGDSRWFRDKLIEAIPEDWQISKTVRYWDMAATEKKIGNDPDEAVGSRVSKTKDNPYKIILEDQVAGCFNWSQLKKLIADTARRDGPYVTVVIEQEPGSGGKNQVAEIQQYFKEQPDLVYHKVEGQRPTDRVQEAYTWFAIANEGNMYLMKNQYWNSKFLAQVDAFTLTGHDDRVTSCSGAVRWLNPFAGWKKVGFLAL